MTTCFKHGLWVLSAGAVAAAALVVVAGASDVFSVAFDVIWFVMNSTIIIHKHHLPPSRLL